ncbi:hypothetical protein B0T16DRAFT_518205, partial [Cercophora newfieldiana]
MADIYGNARYTLAADSARDSTQGCRVSANQTAQGLQPLRDQRWYFDLDVDGQRLRILAYKPKSWIKELGDTPGNENEPLTDWNPLRWRAWAFQERELSPRVIHFSENMLLWECRTLRASSELPWEECPSYRAAQYPRIPIPNSPAEVVDLSTAKLRDSWFGAIEDYSARALTQEEDRLPALAGLASRFQQGAPETEYLCGLWSN